MIQIIFHEASSEAQHIQIAVKDGDEEEEVNLVVSESSELSCVYAFAIASSCGEILDLYESDSLSTKVFHFNAETSVSSYSTSNDLKIFRELTEAIHDFQEFLHQILEDENQCLEDFLCEAAPSNLQDACDFIGYVMKCQVLGSSFETATENYLKSSAEAVRAIRSELIRTPEDLAALLPGKGNERKMRL